MRVCVLIFKHHNLFEDNIFKKFFSSFMSNISVISPKQGLNTQVIWFYSNFFSTEIISYLYELKKVIILL